jgi:transmembrane sensor
MTRRQYELIYEKYLAGEASSDEINQLKTYADDFELQTSAGLDEENYQFREQHILNKITHTLQPGRQPNRLRYLLWLSAAAAVIIFAVSGLLFFRNNSANTSVPRSATAGVIKQNDVAPGANKAILTLASGKKVILNSVTNGTIAQHGGIVVKKLADGKLQYTVQGSQVADIANNTISTPRGGQYQIMLADGTKVWLNAASSLKFPTAFKGKERTVELTGEAYFEVAKNKEMPFTVKFNNTQVQVLGTHFDIMAYPDETETKTTLVEGSVRVSNNTDMQILMPGQQAIAVKNGHMQIVKANVEEALAWKNGYFIFRNADLRQIMKQAERWYDVDVVYDGDIKSRTFGGRISKYKNISELLKNLELAGNIHFKVSGNKVTVTE